MLEDKRLDDAASAEDIEKYMKALGITTLNDLQMNNPYVSFAQ